MACFALWNKGVVGFIAATKHPSRPLPFGVLSSGWSWAEDRLRSWQISLQTGIFWPSCIVAVFPMMVENAAEAVWVVEEARRYAAPIPFIHPRGAMRWIDLTRSRALPRE